MLLRDRGVALRARVKIFDYVQHALRRQLLSLERIDEVDYLQRASRCKTKTNLTNCTFGLRESSHLASLRASETGQAFQLPRAKPIMAEENSKAGSQGSLSLRKATSALNLPTCDSLRSARSRDKGLLVAFTGNARRLMMPIPVFLQFVDAQLWDVLLLKKCARNSYLLGIEGISTDFRGLIDYIETTTSAMQHRSVITLGASGGGFAAIWAAVLMRATRGICVRKSASSLPS